MAKIKEVCEKTGLSEKAVRLYMKEGLVTPETEEGIYRNAYSFSEKDIELLKDIAVLRNAGFGISDIRQMQQHPELVPAMIEEKQTLLETEIYEKKRLQNALERLSETERGTAKNLAKGLEPTMQQKELRKPVKSKRFQYVTIAVGVSSLLLALMYVQYGAYMVISICSAVTGILGAVSIFMACRYLSLNRRAESMPKKGEGYIAGVVQNGGIDISFARAGGGMAGTKEPGNGGFWLFAMMFWNEIRPDNWYPVIQYHTQNAEDEIQAATFPYGAFKNTWKEGTMIEIAWNPNESSMVLPLETGWMKKKALFYTSVGIGLWIAAVGVWCLM